MIGLVAALTCVAVLGGLNLAQQRRLHAARHDLLTGLAGRRLWKSRAEHAMRRPDDVVVLIIDGDGFKLINDDHGHAAGDAVLAAFGRRLRAWVGSRGSAGRLGGDEFAVYLRVPKTTDLTNDLDVLCAKLSEPVRHAGSTLRASASIGVAIANGLGAPTLSHMMGAADAAMYEAKHSGGGTWHSDQLRHEPLRWSSA